MTPAEILAAAGGARARTFGKSRIAEQVSVYMQGISKAGIQVDEAAAAFQQIGRAASDIAPLKIHKMPPPKTGSDHDPYYLQYEKKRRRR